jgi:hypothetical protein
VAGFALLAFLHEALDAPWPRPRQEPTSSSTSTSPGLFAPGACAWAFRNRHLGWDRNEAHPVATCGRSATSGCCASALADARVNRCSR